VSGVHFGRYAAVPQLHQVAQQQQQRVVTELQALVGRCQPQVL
jgi:hypothetical protein